MTTTLTSSNFNMEVMQSSKPVLIDFYANWCMPCKMLAPVIEEIASEVQDVKICKVNVDEQSELAQQFQIMSIPTLVVMKNGKVVNKSMGARPKRDILNMLRS